MFKTKMRIRINAHDVIDFVRLLGQFGLRFEFSDEYSVVDDIDPDRKLRWRRFYVYGTRRQLKKFEKVLDKYIAK